jgi:hypothetical protein
MRGLETSHGASALAVAALAGWMIAVPAAAGPQHGGHSGGGRATSSHPSSGGGHQASAPRGGGGAGSSAPRTSGATSRPSGTSGGSTASTPADPTRPTSNRAPTSGTVVGRATQAVPGSGGPTVVIPQGYYGGFYPWGYAGLGFGGYYGGYYSYYDPSPYGGGDYGQPYYNTSGYDDGMLRLKVKPKNAMVYVDGYFAGVVDDFDGVFQSLHVEPGTHHIEIRADGYEPLELDIQIQPYRKITYSGELKKIQ